VSLIKEYSKYYSEESKKYDAQLFKHPYESYRNLAINEKLISYFPDKKDLSVLDAGCGTGENTIRLILENMNSPKVTGVDFAQGMVEKSRSKYPGCKFYQALLNKLPFPDSHFDMILSREVLEHVLESEAALKDMCRVLKSGGILILSTPSWFGLIGPFYFIKKMLGKMELVENWRSPMRLSAMLKKAGFTAQIIDGVCPVLYHEALPEFLVALVKKLDKILLRLPLIKYFGRVAVIKAQK